MYFHKRSHGKVLYAVPMSKKREPLELQKGEATPPKKKNKPWAKI